MLKRKMDVGFFLRWFIFATIISVCISVWAGEQFQNNKLVRNAIDCKYSDWSTWSNCTDCTQIGIRTRSIIHDSNGGKPCSAQALVQTESCNSILSCNDLNCQYTSWSQWTECPSACFSPDLDCTALPQRSRIRNVLRSALPGGLPCDWSTLMQTQDCLPGAECAPDVNCIVGPTRPDIDCDACLAPCTATGVSEWALCTRSIEQTASGNGMQCLQDALVYSITCNVPDCKDQCMQNNYGAFSRCGAPCGPSTFVSSTGMECPAVSVSDCNLATCPTGGFDVAAGNCLVLPQESCSYSTTISKSQCMSRCAMDPLCSFTFESNSSIYYLSVSSSCAAGTNSVSTWNPASNACIDPTWDMVGAACLFLCETPDVQSISNRGIVFPFDNGSQSCPIHLDLLSASGACDVGQPLTNTEGLGTIPFGTALFYYSDHSKTVYDYSDLVSYTLYCPLSQDCEYIPWKDARPWGTCSGNCAQNVGSRQQVRSILYPNSGLGNECNLAELVRVAPCNRDSITSASDMVCLPIQLSKTEIQCMNLCSSTQCLSMQFITMPFAGNELFLSQSTGPIDPSQSFPGYEIASDLDLLQAYEEGMQVFQAGWFSNSNLQFLLTSPSVLAHTTSRESNACILSAVPFATTQSFLDGNIFKCSFSGIDWLQQTYSVVTIPGAQQCPFNYSATINESVCSRTRQFGCSSPYIAVNGLCVLPNSDHPELLSQYGVGSVYQQSYLGPVGFHVYSSQTSSNIWLRGPKPLTSPPFFSTSQNVSVYGNFSYTTIQHQSSAMCSVSPHKIDFYLSSCTSASNVSTSTLLDVPCQFSRQCSLTDWMSSEQCGDCRIRNIFQTRSIVSQAGEGGIPCSQYPLTQIVSCNTPPCPDPNIPICLHQSFPSSYTNACLLLDRSTVFPELWDAGVLSVWAQLLYTGLFTLQSDMKGSMSFLVGGISIPDDLALALNSQCLNDDLSAPECIVGVNRSKEPTTTYSLTTANNIVQGWIEQPCATNSSFQQCVQERIQSYDTGAKVFVDGSWTCPSMCSYISVPDVCAWNGGQNECANCINILDPTTGVKYVTANERIDLSCNSTIASTYSIACPNSIPVCPSLQVCPIGCDGSPCNSVSGLGSCSLINNTYSCACVNSSSPDCGIECPLGSNGLECSGNFISCDGIQCTCTAGWSGRVCDQFGVALLGFLQTSLVESTVQTTLYTGANSVTEVLSISNQYPCEDIFNPFCTPVNMTMTSPVNPNIPFIPFLSQQASLTRLHNANMCINSGNSMIPSSGYSPSVYFTFQPSISTFTSCQDFGYTLTGQFTDHPSVPPQLQQTFFFLRSSQSFGIDQVTNPPYTRQWSCPSQVDADGNFLFYVFDTEFNLIPYSTLNGCV